ncbi:hypothetical protein [Gordonia sp. DT101]|uniref:hypothetical protein n=1 Tax=Gordonia sp. DT101 TaxID=3416545 RepID=UPI003CF5B173
MSDSRETVVFDGFAKKYTENRPPTPADVRGGGTPRPYDAGDFSKSGLDRGQHVPATSARRPALSAKLTGRAAELWGPIREREIGAWSRVKSRLTPPPSAGETESTIIADALDDGRHRRGIAEDLVDRLAEVTHSTDLARAAERGLNISGTMVARSLSDQIRNSSDALFNAISADLRDLLDEAEDVAAALDGADSAEAAIKAGGNVPAAWGRRDGLRDRYTALAGAVHYVRRATAAGFENRAGSAPDRLGSPVTELSFASSYAVVDNALVDFGASATAAAILRGGF